MRTYIKTFHGYLSFQPGTSPTGPVTVEYRETPGAWEEIDLELLDKVLSPPEPGPGPGPTPPSLIPAAVHPVERTAAYIGRVKSYLQSQGKDLSGPCGAFCIVEWAAWWLAPSNPTAGTLYKPSGNMCKERATDILMFSDARGAIVDVLQDGGGDNHPMWNVSAPGEVELDRWRAPEQP